MKAKRVKTKLRCVLLLVAGLLCFACSAENKAAELFETAAFEEVQFNTDHAKELYQEIIERYPDTETARKARQAMERLSNKSEDIDSHTMESSE
jgi:TolA-binding protein